MHFLAPLYALFVALGVLPVLIHLMGRRRARVRPLPTLLLLYASHRRVAQRTQLRHLLLLLLRMLVLIGVPLCLAKPFFETASDLPAQVSAAQSAVLVIDDSLSMHYQLGGDTLFSRGKKRAVRIIEALPPNAEAALVLGSRGNLSPVGELTGDRARLFSAISSLRPSLRSSDLAGGLRRAAQILATVRRAQRRIYLITDSISHSIDPGLRPPEGVEVDVIDISDGQPLPNRAIVEMHSDPAPSLGARALRVSVEVANFSDAAVKELTATLLVDGRPVASGLVDLPPYGHAVKRFFHIFRNEPAGDAAHSEGSDSGAPQRQKGASGDTALAASGQHHISVSIEPDALPEDDMRHLRVEVQRHLRVLVLDGDPRTLRREDEVFYLEMALHPGDRPGAPSGEDSPFQVSTASLDEELPALSEFDAVFLCNAKAADLGRRQVDKALREYVAGGGGLFIALGNNVDIDAYNTTLADLLPQPLAVVKTPGAVHDSRSDEGRESAPIGNGEHLGRIDHRHPLLLPFSSGRASDSLLSTRFGRYVLLRPTPPSPKAAESGTILSFETGAPALIERPMGRGRVLLFTSTVDRDWTDLAIQPAFLPLMQQSVRYLARAPLRESEPATLVGQPRDIKLQAGDSRVEVTLPSVQKRLFERLGGRQLLSFGDTIEAGFYRVSAASDTGAWKPRAAEYFVVNVDPQESDLRHAAPAVIQGLMRPLARETESGLPAPRRRVEMWHYVGLLLLLFLIGEALLLRSK